MATTITTATFIERVEPGSFFAEESTEPVDDRDPFRHAREAGPRVYGFRYHDIETVEGDLVDGGTAVISRTRVNQSGWYFIDAEVLTLEQVRERNTDGQFDILIANMEVNDWPTVVHCRAGIFLPFGERDTTITS